MALITKALKQIIDDKNLVITESLAEGALRQEARLRKERMQAVLRGYDLSSKRFGPRAREFEIALMCAFEVLYRIEPSSSNKAWIVGVGADGGAWFTHMFWVHKRRPSQEYELPFGITAHGAERMLAQRIAVQSGLAALRQLITLAADRGGDLTQLLSGYLATETELWCVTDSKILTVITEDRLDAKRKQYDAALANGGWLPDRSR
jgi:hypothetical protein